MYCMWLHVCVLLSYTILRPKRKCFQHQIHVHLQEWFWKCTVDSKPSTTLVLVSSSPKHFPVPDTQSTFRDHWCLSSSRTQTPSPGTRYSQSSLPWWAQSLDPCLLISSVRPSRQNFWGRSETQDFNPLNTGPVFVVLIYMYRHQRMSVITNALTYMENKTLKDEKSFPNVFKTYPIPHQGLNCHQNLDIAKCTYICPQQ